MFLNSDLSLFVESKFIDNKLFIQINYHREKECKINNIEVRAGFNRKF